MGVWTGDWLWGLLLIAVSLAVHAIGLGVIATILVRLFGRIIDRSQPFVGSILVFAAIIGLSAMLLVALHGAEVVFWAAAYLALGVLPDFADSVYFSAAMMSTSGADVTMLSPGWKLMGALEAIGGMLLFGLSTAFLFAVLRRAWPLALREEVIRYEQNEC